MFKKLENAKFEKPKPLPVKKEEMKVKLPELVAKPSLPLKSLNEAASDVTPKEVSKEGRG